MLLYHRPVPAKIPKRRSRAGEFFQFISFLEAATMFEADEGFIQDVSIGTPPKHYSSLQLCILTA